MTVINGTSGRDDFTLPLDDGETEVFAGAGDDYITINRRLSGPGTLSVDAGDGDDKIWVQDYGTIRSVVHGGAGADTIYLAGGGLIYGDAGADLYKLRDGPGLGAFTVADFASEDRLDLMSYFEDGASDPFASGRVRFMQAGADALLQLDYNTNWQTFGYFLNVDASTLTASQLGGLKPVIVKADLAVSMTVDVATVMEGGKVLVKVTLPAPATQATEVSIFNSGMGNESRMTYLTLQPGQTTAQTYLVVVEDNVTAPRSPLQISAGITGATIDPRTLASATVSVINNDQNGFSVSTPTPAIAYLNLTQLDAVKPADAAQTPNLVLLASRDIVRALEPFAISTTSVALTAYQFFTGKSPGQAGLKYLVNSPFTVRARHSHGHHDGRSVDEASPEAAALAYLEDVAHDVDDDETVAVIVRDDDTGREQCFRVDLTTGETAPCS